MYKDRATITLQRKDYNKLCGLKIALQQQKGKTLSWGAIIDLICEKYQYKTGEIT